MIIDLGNFIEEERPYWEELETMIDRQTRRGGRMTLEEVERFHYLYERTAGDLARIATFSTEREIRDHLENLVARSYRLVHENRTFRGIPFRAWCWWLWDTFPRTVRCHAMALVLSCAAFFLGSALGGFVIMLDAESQDAIFPQQFSHLLEDPGEWVKSQEADQGKQVSAQRSAFSAMLVTNNVKVSILTMAAGAAYGIGTLLLLFYNGIILGAVAVKFTAAGQVPFLLGWLLPHGVIEIPAILIAGQAGMVLAAALLGHGNRKPLRRRLREKGPAIVTLVGGVAVMLIWAALVEAFLSQYHEPILPYSVKIMFGCIEFGLLLVFLFRPGLGATAEEAHGKIG